MRYLATVRHGDYERDNGQRLTAAGVGQIDRLTENLLNILDESSVKILSSPEMYAVRSALRIASAWGIDFDYRADTSPLLYSKKNQVPAMQDIANLVDREYDGADAVVLMTHTEICDLFPPWFYGARGANRESQMNQVGIVSYGEGTVLDLRNSDLRTALQYV